MAGVAHPPAVKIKKRITNTLLKMEEGKPYLLRFEGAIFRAQAEKMRKPRATPEGGEPAPVKQPPMLAHVLDLTDGFPGTPCQIIVPVVLESELRAAYPDDLYVNRTFQVTRHKSPSKNYNLFDINEVELETGGETEVSVPAEQEAKRETKRKR
jgi:hypothetical protein